MIADTTNFYARVDGALSRREVADLYASAGWSMRKCGWDEFEVRCATGELVIESERPILVHGPVSEIASNVDRVVEPLRSAKLAFSAECYDDDRRLIRTVASTD